MRPAVEVTMHATSCRLLPIAEGMATGGLVAWSGGVPERFLRDAPRIGSDPDPGRTGERQPREPFFVACPGAPARRV